MHEKIVGVTVKVLGLSRNCSEREIEKMRKRKKEYHITVRRILLSCPFEA